jgi:hypothetical protein
LDELKTLLLRLRKRLPRSVRHMARLSWHVVPRRQFSAGMPPDLIEDCRMCASRLDLPSKLPRHGRIAEVGTARGDFAMHILAAAEPSELHLIDLDFADLHAALRADARVTLHPGLSHEVLARFPDDYFDWIYIDADHSFVGVLRDADAAAGKVRPGGHLVFNDFAHCDSELGAYGVHRAVVEFATTRQWPFSWFAYEPNALYDVALRRPIAAPALQPSTST